MQLRIPLNSGDMQPKDAKVTIRGRGELLLGAANLGVIVSLLAPAGVGAQHLCRSPLVTD